MSSAAKQILDKMKENKEATDSVLDAIKSGQDELHDEIRELRKEAREDNKEIWGEINEIRKCQTKLKVQDEKKNGRLRILEEGRKMDLNRNQRVDEHLTKPGIHFDEELREETKAEYLAKKKFLAAILLLLATAASALTAWIANGLPGLGP